MSQNYIFRLHNSGEVQLKDWDTSRKIDKNAIANITDTISRGNQAKVATSIPSPFARMHLFETAFDFVSENQVGNSLYHKLVSDCLDLFQMLFDLGENKDVTFSKWNKETQLAQLSQAGVPAAHKLLADSLRIFLDSDPHASQSENRFGHLRDFVFIFYKGILVGGTSPLTVFFTSPNWEREMNRHQWKISSTTQDIFFDDQLAALHQRDQIFQEFMHKFYLAFKPQLNNSAPALARYIRNSLEHASSDIKYKLNHDWLSYGPDEFVHEYEAIPLSENSNENIYSGQFPVVKRKTVDRKLAVETKSSFVIDATVDYYKHYQDAATGIGVTIPKPLVLANNYNNPGMTYIEGLWDPKIVVPDVPYVPLHERILPGNASVKYPYITVGDFLEDTLVEVPYLMNNEYFFTGYKGDFKYLLPVKKEYFNFFRLEDLRNNISIQINENISVIVNLKVPVRNGKHLLFSKEYPLNDKRSIIKARFGLGIFPFYKITDQQQLNDYSVLLADKDLEEVKLAYYAFEDIIKGKAIEAERTNRVQKQGITAGSSHFRIRGKSFDAIEMSTGYFKGLIIPDWKETRREIAAAHGIQRFTFAVDFGTSNTHIAYNTQNHPEVMPFDISEEDLQVVMLNKRDVSTDVARSFEFGFGTLPEVQSIKKREYVPSIIGEQYKAEIAFPIRTATCESKTFVNERTNLFGNINIGYSVDAEETILKDSFFKTNIKWGLENNKNDDNARDRVEAFFLQLLWQIKNKVLLNEGKLDETQIVWFVPISMSRTTKGIFRDLWSKSLKVVFGDETAVQLHQETESVVPYFALKRQFKLLSSQDALNIDIGGGTTDLLFFIKSSDRYVSTSFRFAGNDIWGDGFAKGAKDNGFLQMMRNKVDMNEVIFTDKLIKSYFDTADRNPLFDSSDVISFIFKYDSTFKIADKIRVHPYLKLILLLHYSAIIYHVAQLIEQLGIQVPKYLTFTGKGSEYIKIISSNESDINELTALLLEKFSSVQAPSMFEVRLSENPKQATANGGVLKLQDASGQIRTEIQTHYGFAETKGTDKVYTLTDINTLKQPVLENVNRFIDLVFTDRDITRFFKEFDVKLTHETLDIQNFLKEQARLSFEEMAFTLKGDQTDDIPETMFFWAFKDSFYRLSQHLFHLS